MNWFDKLMEQERQKKAQRVELNGKEISFTERMKLPVKTRIKKFLDGSLKMKE